MLKIASSIYDPSNDAKSRTQMFRDLRSGIDVYELELNGGHCLHDELPEDVSNAVVKWLMFRDPFNRKLNDMIR